MNLAMPTTPPGDARKSKSAGAKRTAAAKPAPDKARSAKARPASADAAAHILPAAKGPRTVSHRKIEEAVEKVFRERAPARA
jgi:hypothetical protein